MEHDTFAARITNFGLIRFQYFIGGCLGYILQTKKSNLAAGRHLYLLISNNYHSIAAKIIKLNSFSSEFELRWYRLYVANTKMQCTVMMPS